MDEKNITGEKQAAVSPINGQEPPPEHRFKPGQSGNPKGYRKGQLNLKTILSRWLSVECPKDLIINTKTGQTVRQFLETIFPGANLENVTMYDLMAIRQMQNAIARGDTKAFQEIADRFEGKAIQTMHMGVSPENVQPYLDRVAELMERDDDGVDPESAASEAEESDADSAEV